MFAGVHRNDLLLLQAVPACARMVLGNNFVVAVEEVVARYYNYYC